MHDTLKLLEKNRRQKRVKENERKESGVGKERGMMKRKSKLARKALAAFIFGRDDPCHTRLAVAVALRWSLLRNVILTHCCN
jgi:hypothetical protein